MINRDLLAGLTLQLSRIIKALEIKAFIFCGGDRSRTGVQTYSSKAFYMLISALIVGKVQELKKPTSSLAV